MGAVGKAWSILRALGRHAPSCPKQLQQVPWESGALDDPSVQEREPPPVPTWALTLQAQALKAMVS